MHIRCGHCHGTVWVDVKPDSKQRFGGSCLTCGKKYGLQGGLGDERDRERISEEARQLVREAQIDLPSAYSVLLGVSSLEDVLELDRASAASAAPPTPARELLLEEAEPGYDPGYAPAVRAGLLTASQALARGSRDTCAALLRQRHGFSFELAFDVADNKVPLLEALRRRRAEPGTLELVLPGPAHAGSRRAWWLAGGVIVGLGALAWVVISGAPRTATNAQLSIPGAQVRTDVAGRVVQVSAGDPRKVLAAYCASGNERPFEPVDLAPADDEGVDTRLALMRKTGRSGQLYSIVVRQKSPGRWVAGDGRGPLVPEPVTARVANKP